MTRQILILGMHRSGTSALTELVTKLCINTSRNEINTSANWENEHGFWEREDVKNTNKFILSQANSSWYNLKNFSIEKLDNNVLKQFIVKAESIIKKLDKKTLWVIKDPRLCLTLPLWLKLLDSPICIIIWRDPYVVAKSLNTRNNFSINQGIALWEYYNLAALLNTRKLPRLLVHYADLIATPELVINNITRYFNKNNITLLNKLETPETKQIIDPSLNHSSGIEADMMGELLNSQQMELFYFLENGSTKNSFKYPQLSLGAKIALEEFDKINIHEARSEFLDIALTSSFSILESNQYRWTKNVFNVIRKLTNRKKDSLVLRSEKSLYDILSFIASSRLKELHLKGRIYSNSKKNIQLTKQVNVDLRDIVEVETDIIMCVHNALEDVKAALVSVFKQPHSFSKFIIVNDGSDQSTTKYLTAFTQKNDKCLLINHEQALGYTKSANVGLKMSTAPFRILINSDIIVPNNWINYLKRAAYSSEKIGITGPLSNAASWQSIPFVKDQYGEWATNDIPRNWSIDDVQSLIDRISERRYPKVRLLNGFCLGIKKEVFKKIGYLDEINFPQGYGEENDFCIRAFEAGFGLTVTDDLFVYHAKSKSFGNARRKVLSLNASKKLKSKYGKEFSVKYTRELCESKVLERIRTRTQTSFNYNFPLCEEEQSTLLNLLFILPSKPGSGGVHSVIQEVQGLNELGFNTNIAVPCCYLKEYKKYYSKNIIKSIYFYATYQEIFHISNYFNVIVATICSSVKLLKNIWEKDSSFLPAYYIQDYEPWFFRKGSKLRRLAASTYDSIPAMCCFAKTDWICKIVNDKHGVKVNRVMPSLDRKLFFPSPNVVSRTIVYPVRIIAMIRPSSPRRRAAETMEVLKLIKARLKKKVEIHIFGTGSSDPEYLSLVRDFEFTNHGFLTREDVANLLRQSNIFIDMSEWQAFGRTGIEAMACGCVSILPVSGGVHEYAINKHNALIVDTNNAESVIGSVEFLVKSPDTLSRYAINGLKDIRRYSVLLASRTEAILFMEKYKEYIVNSHEFRAKI